MTPEHTDFLQFLNEYAAEELSKAKGSSKVKKEDAKIESPCNDVPLVVSPTTSILGWPDIILPNP